MPKGSEELTHTRREEILLACATLYESMNFKDITMKDISDATSFTRTSIYNYFQTKEEIFLALFQREYELWMEDLTRLAENNDHLSKDAFASALAATLEKRERLLKLLSMNLYDMEENSRLEHVITFKTAYGNSMKAVKRCLSKFFPEMSEAEKTEFIYTFYPFMYGIYPYTVVTAKQREAMEKAGVDYTYFSISEIASMGIKKFLSV